MATKLQFKLYFNTFYAASVGIKLHLNLFYAASEGNGK